MTTTTKAHGTHSVTRDYAHKEFGTVGSVQFNYPAGPFVLDGKDLPAQSVQYLMTFALQSLQDSYAGAKDAAEAKAAFGKKLDRIIAGTIATGGPRRSPLEVEIEVVAKAQLAALAEAKGKVLPKASTPEYKAMLAKVIEANHDTLAPIAQANLDARAKPLNIELDF